MIGDVGENVGEPGARVDVVELRGFDQGEDGSGPATAAVGAGEGPVLASDREATQRPLGGVVGEADAVVVEEARERRPSLHKIVDGLGQSVFRRQLSSLAVEPGFQSLRELP